MFFNAPRIPALNINFRESPNQLFYHLTKDNMKYAEEMVRDPWKPIIYLTSMLRIGQSLSIYSLLPYKDPEDPDRTYTTAIDVRYIIGFHGSLTISSAYFILSLVRW